MSTSCGDISASLAGLQSAINGIGAATDAKIAPLLVKINALEAALARANGGDTVKKSELESLVNPLIGVAVGGFATKTQLDNMGVSFATKGELSTVNGKASSALGQSTSAIAKVEQVASTTSNLSFEIRKVESVANNASDLAKRVDPNDIKRALAEAAEAKKDVRVVFEIAQDAKGTSSNAASKAGSAASAADDAKRLAGKASAEAAEAGGKAARAVGEAAEAAGKATKALSWADEALRGLGKFGAKLAQFAPLLALLGVVSTLLDVAMNTGALVILGQRIDAVEAGLDQLSADMSKILGIITALKNDLTAQIKKISGEIAALKTSVETRLQELTTQVSKDISDMKSFVANELKRTLTDINIFIKDFTQSINAKLQGLEDKLNALGKPNLDPLWAAINGLTSKVSNLEGLSQKIARLEADLASVPNLIDQKVRDALKGFEGKLSELKNSFDKSIADLKSSFNKSIADINNTISDIKKTLGAHGAELSRLASLIAGGVGITALATYTYGALTSRVSSVNSTVNNNLQPRVQRLENQVITIDTETSKMPCRYSPGLDQQNLATSNRNQQIMLGMEAFNTVQMASVQSKLGPQIGGGLSGAAQRLITSVNNITKTIANSFEKTWKFLKLDRILNVLIFAASIHNAAMLSSSLGSTLLDVTSSVLAAIGLKDANGTPFDLGEFFGKQFEELIKGIVGAEAYEGNKKKWNAANRIITSAANLLGSIQSMMNNVFEALEIIGGWIAKMANGMKFDGLVSDNIFPWFNTNPNFKSPVFRAMEKLNNLDDAASQIYQISTNVVDFRESAENLEQQKVELRKAMTDYQVAETAAQTAKDAANASPEISAADKAPAAEQ